MERNRKHTDRRYGLILLTVATILIVTIVIAGIFITIFTNDPDLKKILLLILLVLVIAIGLATFLFSEYQRKQALKKRSRCDELWLQRTLEEHRRTTRPMPPFTENTSWALTIPWKHETQGITASNENNNNGSPASTTRTTLPPYSPPSS